MLLVQGREDRSLESDGRPMVHLLLGVVAALDFFDAYDLIVDERVRLTTAQRVRPGT